MKAIEICCIFLLNRSLKIHHLRDHPSGGKGRKPPELIWLKYIPSVSLDYSPDVKQLVEIKYGRPPGCTRRDGRRRGH